MAGAGRQALTRRGITMTETRRSYELRSPYILFMGHPMDKEPFAYVWYDTIKKTAYLDFDFVRGPGGEYPSLSAMYEAIAKWVDSLTVPEE